MTKMKFREESDPLGELLAANYVIVPCTDEHPAGQYCPGWTWVRKDFLPAEAPATNEEQRS
jgi:hypothetical protein